MIVSRLCSASDELKRESAMAELSQWVTFPPQTFGPSAPANLDAGLRNGLTFEQVVAMFGEPKQIQTSRKTD